MTDDRVELTTEQIMLIRQGAVRLRHQFDGTFNTETMERYMLDSKDLLHSNAKFYPGKRYEDWDLPDPSGQPIEVVREIRDDIRNRVEALIASLGLDVAAADGQR